MKFNKGVVVKHFENEEAWKEARKIGSSDANILGMYKMYDLEKINYLYKYRSPFIMWKEKKKEYEQERDFNAKVRLDVGHYMERFMADNLKELFKERLNIDVAEVELVSNTDICYNDNYPLWSCTPDCYIRIGRKWYIVEFKTHNSHVAWSEGFPPLQHVLQVNQQLAVLNMDEAYLVGFIDNAFLTPELIQLDKELVGITYDATQDFDLCLKSDTRPKLYGVAAEADYFKITLGDLLEVEGGEEFVSGDITAEEMEEYFRIKMNKKDVEAEAANLKMKMGAIENMAKLAMEKNQVNKVKCGEKYYAEYKTASNGSKRFYFKKLKK